MRKVNFEKRYGIAMRSIFSTLNPIKNRFKRTECIVHKYIINNSLNTLKNYGYTEIYDFYNDYKDELLNGAVWVDLDYKSLNHFFHYKYHKGVYGFSNAYDECMKYYDIVQKNFAAKNYSVANFYLGACLHLIQDVTVPQHVNNKFLKKHRYFEGWIKNKVKKGYDFTSNKIERQLTVFDYFISNSSYANKVNMYYKHLEEEKRYYKISKNIIAKAQSTTCGFLIDIYKQNDKSLNEADVKQA
ncbi:MAG: zinc dependent phospholipase C family protein [Oscillospiraceae bacterium]|nr:zinc dependent phospholipase C family protein [Oscillospiraceae bacterium]